MPRLFACIISIARRQELISVARQFSYAIETLDDGILFDVSGLEKLMGRPNAIAKRIFNELQDQQISGSIAVAETIETATLLARQKRGLEHTVHSPDEFQRLPLHDLAISDDTLNVFHDLGIRRIDDLLAVPREELVGRYGRAFEEVIRTIEQRGASLIKPNVKENHVAWSFELDFPVEDFEQLIFILNHGLERVFDQVEHYGFSTEHIRLQFKLNNKTDRDYDIKASFPTLDKSFWLKLINLRISMDPPDAGIVAFRVVAFFTKPRAAQRGLYAASRPEPESLLLTVGKLKKLVGEENVGIPTLLNERLDRAFTLDADNLPAGKERLEIREENAVIAFSYFQPPIPAEVLVRDKRLVFIRTRYFAGHVAEYSGVWKANSKWWDQSWKTQEWDIEIENNGVYRLCKAGEDWFVVGEYD